MHQRGHRKNSEEKIKTHRWKPLSNTYLILFITIKKDKDLTKLYSKEPKTYASSHVHFGGWEISYNGKGRTRLVKETMESINFVSKTIYLHVIYSHWLVGLAVPYVHGFSVFLETLVHELAHCLLGDFDLDLASEHNDEHKKLTREISGYLGKLPEVKELERLQREFSKIILRRQKVEWWCERDTLNCLSLSLSLFIAQQSVR